jgi:hypothetical protein
MIAQLHRQLFTSLLQKDSRDKIIDESEKIPYIKRFNLNHTHKMRRRANTSIV